MATLLKRTITQCDLFDQKICLFVFDGVCYVRITDEVTGHVLINMPDEFTSECIFVTFLTVPEQLNKTCNIGVRTSFSKEGIAQMIADTQKSLNAKSNPKSDSHDSDIVPRNVSTDPDFVSKKELIKQIRYFTHGLTQESIEIVCNAITEFAGKVEINKENIDDRISRIFMLLDDHAGDVDVFKTLTIDQACFLARIFADVSHAKTKLGCKDELQIAELENELRWLIEIMTHTNKKIITR